MNIAEVLNFGAEMSLAPREWSILFMGERLFLLWLKPSPRIVIPLQPSLIVSGI